MVQYENKFRNVRLNSRTIFLVLVINQQLAFESNIYQSYLRINQNNILSYVSSGEIVLSIILS